MPVLAISDLGVSLLVGVSSLAGAAIGGLIAGFISLKVEQRRQEFAIERDIELERTAANVAARLVWEELVGTSTTLKQAISEGNWGYMPAATDTWDQHKEVLGATLDLDEWIKVTSAVTISNLLQDVYEPHKPISGDLNLENWVGDVEQGIAALHRHMRDLAKPTAPERSTAETR